VEEEEGGNGQACKGIIASIHTGVVVLAKLGYSVFSGTIRMTTNQNHCLHMHSILVKIGDLTNHKRREL